MRRRREACASGGSDFRRLCRSLPPIGLEGLAMIAAAQDLPVRAARLWGAAEALREATDERRWHVFRHAYDRALAAARAQLAEPDWTIAWAAGRALTAAQAVAESWRMLARRLFQLNSLGWFHPANQALFAHPLLWNAQAMLAQMRQHGCRTPKDHCFCSAL